MVNFAKKAISPVVATALLLVVAVVAVVGFQTWFSTFQSDIQSDVEVKGDQGSSIIVERLEGTTNVTVYYRNVASTLVDVTAIRITRNGATLCEYSNSSVVDASPTSVNSTNLANGCSLSTATTYNVVIITTGGVYQESEIAR